MLADTGGNRAGDCAHLLSPGQRHFTHQPQLIWSSAAAPVTPGGVTALVARAQRPCRFEIPISWLLLVETPSEG